MAANDLTTLSNAGAWLQVAPGTDDTTLQRLITAFSGRIQKWMGYNVLQSTYTRTFNGQGTRQFFVPDLPLVSVQSVSVDGYAVSAGQFSGGAQQSGFYSDNSSVCLVGYMFTRGFQNVTLGYTAGYGAVPFDIEQACLDWMKTAYFRKVSSVGPDVQSIKAGDTQVTWSSQGATVTDPYLVPIPAAIYAMLSDYQRKIQIPGYTFQ